MESVQLDHEEIAVRTTPRPEVPGAVRSRIKADEIAMRLGSEHFRKAHGLKYAYVTGAMYRGIASREMVVSMGKAGMMGFLGTGGLPLDRIAEDIDFIQRELSPQQAYGMNLIANVGGGDIEMRTVELFLAKGVKNIEASAFMQITPALVHYRLAGLRKTADGSVECRNKVLAKLSRPEVARAFMSPAPERLVAKLLAEGRITAEQAELSAKVPMADDICVEADSGGHTDQGVGLVMLSSIQRLRDELGHDDKTVRLGMAGGIGTPNAVAAAFVMGADFVMTGSINQCTVEAGTSNAVKDMLQDIDIQDTAYAPAGDMFELGAKVQVLKKGVFFPARANRLSMLYQQYNAIEEFPPAVRQQLEEKYFKKSLDQIWAETQAFFEGRGRHDEVEKANANPKHKMALVFRWYFGHSMRVAFSGDENNKVDYQIHTGPALGAFNRWVKGTALEDWRSRKVDEIARLLMQEAAVILVDRFKAIGLANANE